MQLFELIQRKCQDNGFPLVGAVDLDASLQDLTLHAQRYEQWIENGFHGEMAYLSRGLERRKDPRLLFPQTQSVLCVARPTRRLPLGSLDPSKGPRIARYAAGPDYHDSMKADLEEALNQVNSALLEQGRNALQFKICVDTSAVLERTWANLCGLGWIGKNTLLIHPKYGSYLLLGVALLDQALDRIPSPHPNYCGSCAKCIQGCPTEALTSPGWLDSRKCIAYLTLEKRGDWEPSSPTEKMGSWIAGCDICQEVCPFNRKPEKEDRLKEGGMFDDFLTWEYLQSETEDQYRARVRKTALSRVKPEMAKRNLKQALENSQIDSDSLC